MYMLKQNKGALIESKIGEDIPAQGDRAGKDSVGSLSPGKEVFPA